jgi:hypothetical protein
VSPSACIVEGTPLVGVTRLPFTVKVGDLVDAIGPNPFDGPVRPLDVKPGQTVSAYTVIGPAPNCGDTRRDGRVSGTITFSANLKSISVTVQSCRQYGAQVQVGIGPFLPT